MSELAQNDVRVHRPTVGLETVASYVTPPVKKERRMPRELYEFFERAIRTSGARSSGASELG